MLVVAGKPGQLGNMLILSSHLIAAAIENGVTVANLAFDDYAQYFEGTHQDPWCRFPPTPSRWRPSESARRIRYRAAHAAVRVLGRLGGGVGPIRAVVMTDWTTVYPLDDPGFRELARSTSLLLMRGWLFRDPAAVNRHATAIRAYFQPRARHRAVVASALQRARADGDVLIGVHIRHGYLQSASHRQHWYPREQYPVFMDRVQRLFPGRRVKFLICSDVFQEPTLFARHAVTFGPNHVVEDMYSFAGCDYLVGPPSTYTMWASFHGKVPLYAVHNSEHIPTLDDFRVSAL